MSRFISFCFTAYRLGALWLAYTSGSLGLVMGAAIAWAHDATLITTALAAFGGLVAGVLVLSLALAYLQHQSGLCSPVTLRWFKMPLRRVSWNFDHYLTGPSGRVSRFGPSFDINWGDGITIKEAYIECKRTDTKTDVLIERGNPYMKAENTYYPRGKTYHCQALFYNPAKKQVADLEGITTQEFLAKYDGFVFIFKYDSTEFRRSFRRSEIESMFQCYWQRSHPRPEPIPQGGASQSGTQTLPTRPEQQELLLAPRYEPEEIRRMLLALGGLRDVIEEKCRPSYESFLRITEQWDLLLRQIGARQVAERLGPIRNDVRQAERDIDKVLNANQHYFTELRLTIFDTPDPPGYGVDSALSMMMDDLMELAGSDNIDIVKWIRPRFDESVRMAVQYGDWIGKASHRITEKTRELRGW